MKAMRSLFFLGVITLFASQWSLAQDEPLQTVDEAAGAVEISRELLARQRAIEDMQSELGIYDVALIEAYSDLGAFYIEQEDYASAIALYSEALQIVRINTGLYSEQQLPVIGALIENNSRLEAWPEVDDLQQLNYHIASRLYELKDPNYSAAVERFGSWRLRVLRENLLEQGYWNLINGAEDLSEFYQRALARLETEGETRQEDLLGIVFGKSQADITLARSIAATPYTSFEGNESRYVSQTRCSNVRTTSGQIVRQCQTVQVENPRYRQSQRDAKQYALSRHTRAVMNSIERLRLIKDQSTSLTSIEKQALDVRIAELQTESEQLLRASRRMRLF